MYVVNPISEDDQLTDFSLTPFEDDSTSDVVEMVIGSIAADIKSSGSNSILMKGIEKMSDPKASNDALTLDIEKLTDPATSISSLTSLLSNSGSSLPSMPTMPFMTPMPFMPMLGGATWGWPGQNGNGMEQWEEYKSKAESFFGQQINLQKSSMIVVKDWWDSFFV